MTRRFALLMMAAAGLALAACATEPPAAPLAAGGDRAFSERDYVLGANDKVHVTVFNEGSLTGDFVVSQTGVIAYPLIGAVKAEGVTVAALETAIAQKLKPDYVIDPKVSVEVLTYRPFYILGEVGNPGVYPYSPGMTVARAVATANGYTYRGDKTRVFIKRAGGDELAYPSKGTVIRPGDEVRVPERYF